MLPLLCDSAIHTRAVRRRNMAASVVAFLAMHSSRRECGASATRCSSTLLRRGATFLHCASLHGLKQCTPVGACYICMAGPTRAVPHPAHVVKYASTARALVIMIDRHISVTALW